MGSSVWGEKVRAVGGIREWRDGLWPDYYRGFARDSCRKPFSHSLRSTRPCRASAAIFASALKFKSWT